MDQRSGLAGKSSNEKRLERAVNESLRVGMEKMGVFNKGTD